MGCNYRSVGPWASQRPEPLRRRGQPSASPEPASPSLPLTRGQATAGGLTGSAGGPTLAARRWPSCMPYPACWSTFSSSVVDRVPIAISNSSSSARNCSSSARNCSSSDAQPDGRAGSEPIA